MRAKNRANAVALPRQIAMYLVRQLTHTSLTEVGRAFGKDHTTVLYAVDKIQTLLQEDPEIQEDHRHAEPERYHVISGASRRYWRGRIRPPRFAWELACCLRPPKQQTP